MLYKNVGGLPHRIFRRNRAIGPDFQIQLIVVRLLTDARALNPVGRLRDRAENRVNWYLAQWQLHALFSRAVAPALLHDHLDVQVHIIRIGKQKKQVRVDNLNLRRAVQITGRHRTFMVNLQRYANRLRALTPESNLLHIQNQARGILQNMIDRRKLMMHTADRN